MNPSRIAELLQPFLIEPESCHSEPAKAGEVCPEPGRREPAALSPAQIQAISTYIDILLRWNARINLTAIRAPEDIVTRHFGESLFAARHLFPVPSSMHSVAAAVESLADVGSGAGFPGLPIKLWAPQLSVTLIEANHKKAAFLREVTRALTLTDVNIQNARADAVSGSTFNVVTLRAVESFKSILPIAASLLAPSGRLALLIGAAQQDQARSILSSLAWSPPVPIPHSSARTLLIGHMRAPENGDRV
jgi:16S rRNA (guanine527-N7)-methyltransferase